MGFEELSKCHYPKRKRRRRHTNQQQLSILSSFDQNQIRKWPKHTYISPCQLLLSKLTNYGIYLLLLSILCPVLSSTVTMDDGPEPSSAGFLDFENLPVTRFSCDGKVIGGYYADVETGCQMFHVCTLGQKDEIQDIKFLCVNGTVFDQETRVCERVDEVDCSQAEKYYDLNLDLYVPHVTTPKADEVTTTTITTTTTTTTTTRPPSSTTMLFSPIRTFHNHISNSQRFQQEQQPQNPNYQNQDSKGLSFAYFQRNSQQRPLTERNESGSSKGSTGFGQVRQSYLINHRLQESTERYKGINPTGRKVPSSGAKNIFFNSPSSTTIKTTTRRPTPTTTTTTTTTIRTTIPSTSSEEPEYYDEEYADTAMEDTSTGISDVIYETTKDEIEHGQSKRVPNPMPNHSLSSGIKPSGNVQKSQNSTTKDTPNTSAPVYYEDDEYGEEGSVSEYYDDEQAAIINPHQHHFQHVDVPRIPYAKPNVPRVLVTNGKPFLPRLRRQSHHHHFVLVPQPSSSKHFILNYPHQVQ